MRAAIDIAPLTGNRTGVGAFVEGLVKALEQRQDVELAPFAITGHRTDNPLEGGPDRLSRMPARAMFPLWRSVGHPSIEWWTGKVDVVHGTNYVVPPSREDRVGEVVTVHDLTSVHHPEWCAPASRQYPDLLRAAFKRGAHVHTLSFTVAEDVHKVFGLDKDQIHVVAPGIPDFDDSYEATVPVDQYIYAMGTIEPRKDYPTLLRAFDKVASNVPGIKLVIAGVKGWETEPFDRALESMTHLGRVEILGYTSPEKREGLLRNASMLIYPSLYEGFGLPPLEAMRRNVPVVATRAGAVPEVTADAALLVDPGDDEALANAMALLLDSEDERSRLTQLGTVRAADFSWDRCASQMVETYEAARAQ